jgi:hypothetical protein
VAWSRLLSLRGGTAIVQICVGLGLQLSCSRYVVLLLCIALRAGVGGLTVEFCWLYRLICYERLCFCSVTSHRFLGHAVISLLLMLVYKAAAGPGATVVLALRTRTEYFYQPVLTLMATMHCEWQAGRELSSSAEHKHSLNVAFQQCVNRQLVTTPAVYTSLIKAGAHANFAP